jgi:hypothetical protein
MDIPNINKLIISAMLITGIALVGKDDSYESRENKGINKSTPIYYWMPKDSPRKVKLATVLSTRAWKEQTGIEFILTKDWSSANLEIHFNKYYPVNGTVASYRKLSEMRGEIVVNANKEDGYKWELGDFGRQDKRIALDGILMHELGHAIGLPDIPCNCNAKDPLANRDKWATMYGRAWEGKMTLEKEDLEMLK